MPGGCERAVHLARAALALHGPQSVMVTIDYKHAFGSISRTKLVEALMRHPQTEPIRPLFDWIYSQSTPQMVHDGPKLAAIIDNEEGLQQGCKLGTFAFCTMSVRPFTRCVSADAIGEHALSVTGIGIVDDFTLIGELDAVMAAFEALSSDPDLADLSMNLQKTAGHWLHNSDPPQAFVDWCSGVGIIYINFSMTTVFD